MANLKLARVSKLFSPTVGLQPLDLEIPFGERLVLLGPSGSGKSTLLRLIAGLEQPDGGEIFLGTADITDTPPHERGIAFVPQRPALYPHLTVRENLALGKNRADSSPLFDIDHLMDRYPHRLSGGEKQRVALARMASRQAAVWLLDEPFAALDPIFRSEIRHNLHLLLDRIPATMLLVTHDPIDALALGRRVGVLGDGRLQQLGTVEELAHQPNNRFVAFTVGRFSLIEGVASNGENSEPEFVSDDGSVRVRLPTAIVGVVAKQPTLKLTLGIRPEDVHVRRSGIVSRGVLFSGWPVVMAEPVGSGWLLTLSRGSSCVKASWPTGSLPRLGIPASWYSPIDRCVWFDHAGQRI